jgi:small multidrug resistance pump
MGGQARENAIQASVFRASSISKRETNCLDRDWKETAVKWLYLLIAISAEVGATTALKASQGFTKLAPSAIVVLGYGLAFYFLSLTLDSIPIGISYAVWSGVGIVFITLIGWRFFDQSLDAPAIIGIALIIAGVALINFLSKSASH